MNRHGGQLSRGEPGCGFPAQGQRCDSVRLTMSEPTPLDTCRTAFGLLSHLYLTPVLVALLRGRVPDHLADGPLPATELAKRAGQPTPYRWCSGAR